MLFFVQKRCPIKHHSRPDLISKGFVKHVQIWKQICIQCQRVVSSSPHRPAFGWVRMSTTQHETITPPPNKKHKTWFPLVGTCQKKVGVEMSKTQHFGIFEKNIFQKWPLKVYTYVYIYGHGHREEEKRERRSFVDDGIPPDKVPCRSRFHRWNGHRHDWATMETKIIRGRWDPSRQAALPVEVPPLEWPPT